MAEKGNPGGAAGFVADEAAPLSEELLRAALGASTDFLCATTPDGRILFLNRFAPGFGPADVVGRSVLDFLEPSSHGAAQACFERVARMQQPSSYESVGMGAERAPTHYETRVAPLVQDGKVVALTLVSSDIGERKRTEATLRENAERLRIAVGAASMGLWDWVPSTDTITWDERVHQIFGTTPGTGPRNIAEYIALVHPDDQPGLRDRSVNAASKGEVMVSEYRIHRPDGATRWVQVQGQALRNDEDQVVKVVGATMDITERRAVEDRLRQTQKLEAVGQLTAGIAHNFNNILTVILPGLDLARKRAPADLAALIDDARMAASRASDLIGELMVVAGPRASLKRRALPLAPLVKRTVDMCRATFDRRIQISTDVPAALPLVSMDAARIEQVLLNLLLNARDAVAHASTRRIKVGASLIDDDAPGRNRTRPGSSLQPPAASPPPTERHVSLWIRDSGVGMDETTRQRVFEPFFTTKHAGEGTGLGLATAYAIVRDHGGALTCTASPGAGATFTLTLPCAESGAVVEPTATPGLHGRGERILLVDDEPAIRRLVAEILRTSGYEIEVAGGVVEGRKAFETDPARFALVLLDLNMTDGSGRDLAKHLRERVPDQRIAYFSGMRVVDAPEADGIIQKPVSHDTLLANVRRILDERGST